jgi:hypothetical protein
MEGKLVSCFPSIAGNKQNKQEESCLEVLKNKRGWKPKGSSMDTGEGRKEVVIMNLTNLQLMLQR